MKKLLSIFAILLSFSANAQRDSVAKVSQQLLYTGSGDSVSVPVSVPVGATYVTRKMYGIDLGRSKLDSITLSGDSLFSFNKSGAKKFVGIISADLPFLATDPSTSPIVGLNGVILGTTTLLEAVQELVYPSQPPTAGLTITYGVTTLNAINLEMMAAGSDLPVVLNWSGGRQLKTLLISTINVDGVNQSFSQPSAGAAVTGTKSATVPRNTNTEFIITVTTTDGKSASVRAYFSFYLNRYYGFTSSVTPSDGDIQALTKEFTITRTRGATSSQSPSGSQYFTIAFPENLDPSNVSQIWIGGLDQTAAFTRTVESFTNASGSVQDYIIYVSNNPTSGAISFEIK